jgi:hypothetical protein
VVELTDAARRVYQSAPLNKFMKPTPQISSDDRRTRSDSPATSSRSFPLTDYSFKSTADAVTASAIAQKGITELRTFRKISREFFAAEMSRDNVAEGVFFIWISFVAAWPMAIVIHQLTHWMI